MISTIGQARIYSISQGWKIALTVLSLPLIFGMGAFMFLPFILKRTNEYGFLLFCMLIGGGFMLFFMYCLFATLKSRIEIYADRIRDVGPFKSTEILIQDIGGFKIVPTQYIKTLIIVPKKDLKIKKITIGLILDNQTEFLQWANNNLENLDITKAKIEMKQILQDVQYGDTQEERSLKLESAKKWVKYLTILSFIISFWAILWPRPYKEAIFAVMILPFLCLAIVHYFKGLIKLDGQRRSLYPDGSAAFILPSLALSLRASLDWHVLYSNNFWAPFAEISVLFILIVLALSQDIRNKIGTAILISIFCGVYAYGSVITLNGLLDQSKPEHFWTQVTQKRISTGKHTSYYFKLLEWGPIHQSYEVDVGRIIYNKHEIGDIVDIYLKKGRFSIPWYIIR